jgi:hypothetical protein
VGFIAVLEALPHPESFESLLSPRWGSVVFHPSPRLAPWAAFFRRFAASGVEILRSTCRLGVLATNCLVLAGEFMSSYDLIFLLNLLRGNSGFGRDAA